MPSDHEQGFLNAIKDNPSRHDVRLVYADWLDDYDRPREAFRQKMTVAKQIAVKNKDDDAPRLHLAAICEQYGELDWAEFIRLQCRFARWHRHSHVRPEHCATCDEINRVNKRCDELADKNWWKWIGPQERLLVPGYQADLPGKHWRIWITFRRGLVEEIATTWRVWYGWCMRCAETGVVEMPRGESLRPLIPPLRYRCDHLNAKWMIGSANHLIANNPLHTVYIPDVPDHHSFQFGRPVERQVENKEERCREVTSEWTVLDYGRETKARMAIKLPLSERTHSPHEYVLRLQQFRHEVDEARTPFGFCRWKWPGIEFLPVRNSSELPGTLGANWSEETADIPTSIARVRLIAAQETGDLVYVSLQAGNRYVLASHQFGLPPGTPMERLPNGYWVPISRPRA
jgi:uncharacterized protein (TIGR02996 family)